MHPDFRVTPLLVLVCALAVPVAPLARRADQNSPSAAANDLDVFMRKVLARRDVNRRMLNDYILDEVERFEMLGPGGYPLIRNTREFTWYVRDGMHVRSPVTFDSVTVGTEARQKYENDWIRRERERRERRDKRGKETKEKPADSAASQGDEPDAKNLYTPRFVSEAYFMDFKFEPGNYYLAGREQLDGHDVLRIEYYPTHLFNDEPKPEKQAKSREERGEQEIERRMNKTALVTLWVDPAEYQIVKYTFDNVWLDFLPGAWLVRVDDLRASMTMGQPFTGVWLPREIRVHAGATLANGSFEGGYTRTFSDYREAEVTTKIRIPKTSARQLALPREDSMHLRGASDDSVESRPEVAHGPVVQETPGIETVREIRVHGNAFLTDEEVVRLAGLSVGQPLDAGTLEDIEKRLKASGRFESIEVRKRYRSLSDMQDVAVVLVVHEKPGVRSSASGKATSRPLGRLTDRMMFLPVLNYSDGYGFTYGARFSTVNLLGARERLSVPLTWGGTRRAALEFERAFKRGPITRIETSAGIWRRENPHFDIGDKRVEVRARAERVVARMIRAGIETSRSAVHFGSLKDTLWTLGANAVLDTASDPAFPANAVWLGAGWTGLHVTPGASHSALPRIDRYTTEARGYLRVFRQAVAAARAQYSTASASLPPYERLLVGGSSSLRGFRAGMFEGDKALLASAELRIPITTVLSRAKFGFTWFFDAAKAADFDARLQDAEWNQGVGGGIFVIAPLVHVNLDVGHGLKNGTTRLHLSAGFMF